MSCNVVHGSLKLGVSKAKPGYKPGYNFAICYCF